MKRLRLTLPMAAALAVIAPVALLAALYLLRIVGPTGQLDALEAQAAKTRSDIDALSAFARGEILSDPAALLHEEGAQIVRRIPDGRRDDELADALGKMALDARLSDISIRVDGGLVLAADQGVMPMNTWLLQPNAAQTTRSFRMSLVFRAGYRELAVFLAQVFAMERFVAVDSLVAIRAPPRTQYQLILRAYYR